VTPETGPTPEQRAVELEAAAEIADANGDHLFARVMRDRAGELRSDCANGCAYDAPITIKTIA
jgi:hypothetical protein